MAKQIFVNLPVRDLQESVKFFTKLGYTFDPKYTNENATCMNIGENIYIMLLVEKFFQTFIDKPISNAKKQTEVLIALSASSREEVDEVVRKAIAAGGRKYNEPRDHGFMYQHAYEDLDGHIWEFFYSDPNVEWPSA